MRDPVLDAAPGEARGDVILMYDELIERLRRCASYDPRFVIQDCEDAADAIEDLITALTASNEVIAKSKPKWIPVTERLPDCEHGAEIGNIEWISCGMVHAGCFGRGGKYRDAYFRTWTDAGEGMDAKDADYWRAVTLPEPPESEGE